MIVANKPYVGGKSFQNTGGNLADFLYQNNISGNVVIVEIKTPMTPLLSHTTYRENVHAISSDLAAGLAQVLNAKQSLLENYRQLAGTKLRSPVPLSPRGLLVVGTIPDLSSDEARSFELFRNNQRDIDIVTFDELIEKVRVMIELLHKAGL